MALLTLGVVLLLAAIFVSLICQLLRRRMPGEYSLEWLSEFSVDSYRPMERLLDQRDYEFLATQPGFHSGIARELRAERHRIFRIYLRSLIRDFRTLVGLAELMMVYSEDDRPDLARTIFRLRRQFYLNVITVELRLALLPLPVGAINVGKLLQPLAAMRENIQQLAL